MSGPDTVVQVDTGEEVVQVVVVHTSSPRELHTQVLQSTVDTVPGVQEVEEAVVVEVVVVVVVEVVMKSLIQHFWDHLAADQAGRGETQSSAVE